MSRWLFRNTDRDIRGRLVFWSPQVRTLVYGWLAGVATVALVAGVLATLWADRGWIRQYGAEPAPVAEAEPAPAVPGKEPGRIARSADKTAEAVPDGGLTSATAPDPPDILPGLEIVGAFGFIPLPQLASKAVPVSVSGGSGAPPNSAVRQWCDALAERLGAVQPDDCLHNGFVDSGYRSVEGRPIVVRKYEAARSPGFGRVLLVGGTHGDELTSVGLTFAWLEQLEAHGSNYNWHIVPALNPDGLLAENPRRVNANGVDLNRNLPTIAWQEESRAYWRNVGYEERRFPGDAPASEPETQWLVDEIAAFRPDVIISIHAPYGVLDYDGKFPAPQQLGSLDLHRLGVYPGSLGNFGSRMQGIPVITVELDHAFKMPSQDETARMWDDLNNWLDRYFLSMRQARNGEPDGDTG